MDTIKILHLADMHLDTAFSGLGLDPAAARDRTEELKDTFRRIVEMAAQEQVSVLLVAGDLLEQKSVRKGTVKFVCDLLASLPEIRVFIAPGNHDAATETSFYRTHAWPTNVHIFGPAWEAVRLDDDNRPEGCPALPVTVYGYGFDRFEVSGHLLRDLKVDDPSRINLVVVHGSDVTGLPAGKSPYLPLTPEEVLATGADYVALGHFHKARVVAAVPGPGGQQRVVAQYPGSPESLDFGQTGAHGVAVGEVGKGASRLELRPVGRREHVSLEVAITGAVSPEDVMARVLQAVPEQERRRHLYRIQLTGAVDPSLDVDVAQLQRRLAGEFHVLRLSSAAYPEHDLDRLAREQTARGVFVRRLLAKLEATQDPAEQARWQRVLFTGLDAFEGRVANR